MNPVCLYIRLVYFHRMHGRIFDYRRSNFRSSSRWNAKVRCEKCIENDQPSNILRVAHCILQREGSPPIMNDQNYIPESQGLDQPRDYPGMMRKVVEQRVWLVRLTEPHQVHCDGPVTGRYCGYETSPHIGPGWIAMDHYDRPAPVAFVYIVNSETVDLDPTLLKRPTLKVRPPLPYHLVRCPRTLTMSAMRSESQTI